ncbi:hypothetical protein ASB83_14915 [Listeria monocytogenes]|nr:hypothetical protein [Listeria monocytogenes]
MSVPKVILMRTNEDGTRDQVYAVTHLDAIDGLKELLLDKEIAIGVKSINGQSGDIVLPVFSESDYQRIMAMVKAFENGEIGGGNGNITAEKVGEL